MASAAVARDAPGAVERGQRFAHTRFQVVSAAERESDDAAGAAIEIHRGDDAIQLRAMRLHVAPGAELALFVATEQHEADRTPRAKPGEMNDACGFDHQCGVAAGVQRALAQIPGIQMRAQDDEFVGLFAPADLRNDVFAAGDRSQHIQV